MAKQLAEDVSDVLQSKVDAVLRIADEATQSYLDRASGTESTQCSWYSAYRAVPSSDSDPDTAERFNLTTASLSYSTVRAAPGVDISSSSSLDTICTVSPRVNEVFRQNQVEDPLLTWQYVGTQDGLMMMYPGTEQSRDPVSNAYNPYDPRIRPWYAGASSGPRDVILVLDKSGSMLDHGRLALMKSAANAVLDTMAATDYVQVILFDSSAKVSQCMPGNLVRATPSNLSALRDFIDSAGANGGTNFDGALNKAFDLMDATDRKNTGTGCRTAILFMTDGEPQDGQDGLSVLNSRLKDNDGKPRATIFTYSLGASAPLLDTMACESGGTFSAISDGGDLRGQMSGYYMLFAQGLQRAEGTVFWSAPYLDSNGMGMMITASVPVYDNKDNLDHRKLVGVAGTDVVLTELESLVEKIEGENSYAFVVNRNGETIFHPQLRHNSDYTEPPIYQDIGELEESIVAGGFEEVRNGLISGTSGSATINAVRRIDRGDSAYEGYETTEIRTTYTWEPAGPFTVCYVVAEGESAQTRLVSANSTVASYYHRSLLDPTIATQLDFKAQPADDPLHPNAQITRKTATIKLAPRAFVDSASYLAMEESTDSVSKIQNYFDQDPDSGTVAVNPGLVDGVYYDVERTGDVSSLWENIESRPEGEGVTWLYVGTPLSIRIYPGFVHPNRYYDPTVRTWYKRAQANRGQLALSTPYVDSFGAGRVVTLSKTLQLSSASSDQEIGGVVGLDFGYDTFSQLITTSAQCGNGHDGDVFCFVMDSSGYLIAYDGVTFDFSDLTLQENTENVFVGQHEPELAQSLIDLGVLKQRVYYDPRSEQQCTTYIVDPSVGFGTTGYVEGTLTGCHTGTYRVAPVNNYDTNNGPEAQTNLYLVTIQTYRVRFTCSDQIKASCTRPPALSCSATRAVVDTELTRQQAQCPVFHLSEEALERLRVDETGNSCANGPNVGGATDDTGLSAGTIAGIIIGAVLGLACLCGLICGLVYWCNQDRPSTSTGTTTNNYYYSSSSNNNAGANAPGRRRRVSSRRAGGQQNRPPPYSASYSPPNY